MTKQMKQRFGSSKIMTATETPGTVKMDDSGCTSVLDYGPILNFGSTRIRAARLSQVRSLTWVLLYAGIPTHFIEFLENGGMLVREVQVKDEPLLSPEAENMPRQVGLEVLIRTRISKKFKMRIDNGEVDRAKIVLAEGTVLEAGARLSVPYVEFSAKWIQGDPYLSDEEAMTIGELGYEGLRMLKDFGAHIGSVLEPFCTKAGYDLVDLKIEVAVDPATGNFILIDALSLDEMGLLRDGVQYGKNPLRDYYKTNHPKWVAELKDAMAKGLPMDEWPRIPDLPPSEQRAHELRYESAAADFATVLRDAMN